MTVACSGCGAYCGCAPIEPCCCGPTCADCASRIDAGDGEADLVTSAIANVARPAVVVWAASRRSWMERRARELLQRYIQPMAREDYAYVRSLLQDEIVRAYQDEEA